MKTRLLAIACSVAAISIGAGVRADVIAGWDFSQYEQPGSTAGGGTTPAATNSVFDGNGAGSTAGFYGSASIGGSGTLLPTAGEGQNGTQNGQGYSPRGPITANVSSPFDTGQTAFESFGILSDEGQGATNHFAMAADGSVVIDLSATAPGTADTWAVSFGAKMLNGGGTDGGEIGCAGTCSQPVSVTLDTGSGATAFNLVSVDGGTPSASPIDLEPTQHRYRVTFPNSGDATDSPVVRISMTGDAADGTPLIDNVAIEAIPLPEPGVPLGLLAGGALLAGLRRLRG